SPVLNLLREREARQSLFYFFIRQQEASYFCIFVGMRNLERPTKQAFYFSLMFYIGSLVLLVLKVSIAPILFSFSLMISIIWVFLVLQVIMRSPRITNMQRLFLALFIILLNILSGIVYFFYLRNKVIGQHKI